MDVERTMEFILQQQAKVAESQHAFGERQAAFEKNQAAAEQRQAAAEQRMDRFEKQLNAIRKIIKFGVQTIARHDTAIQALIDDQLRIHQSIEVLTQSQLNTDKSLQRLLDALNRNTGNGHSN